MIMAKNYEDPPRRKNAFILFRNGFISGLGSAFGATIGFVIVSTVVVYVLSLLGGVPLIGQWLASIVDATDRALRAR